MSNKVSFSLVLFASVTASTEQYNVQSCNSGDISLLDLLHRTLRFGQQRCTVLKCTANFLQKGSLLYRHYNSEKFYLLCIKVYSVMIVHPNKTILNGLPY